MRAASSLGDRPVQAKCLVCVGDIKRSQNNNEVKHRTKQIKVAVERLLIEIEMKTCSDRL